MKPVSTATGRPSYSNSMRVGVTADVPRGFEHGDVVLAMQTVCCDVAGDTAADDCDPHRRASAVTRRASRMRAGTDFSSQIKPHAAIARST